jgi:hypothetical protein
LQEEIKDSMPKKVRLRMYHSKPQPLPSLEYLPICYRCGGLAERALDYIDIEVNPDEIDVDLLGKTIESITQK